jgi:CDP-6-deoxy-D-xylo-4-hexulose-3-dehydrase
MKVSAGKHLTGTCGHVGTSSFYPAHQMTMGEGGANYTFDSELYTILLSIRDWGRDCWCLPGKDNTCGKRFDWKLGDLPDGYDHKYVYSHLGYNLKITDMQAAIGVAQLDKLPLFKDRRYENWLTLREGLKDLTDVFVLPEHPAEARPSPFGFALTVKKGVGFSREELTAFLESHKIQTRTVFAGNIVRQPAVFNGKLKYRVSGDLSNTDTVMRSTFWVGVYPGLTKEMLSFMIERIRTFVAKNKTVG